MATGSMTSRTRQIRLIGPRSWQRLGAQVRLQPCTQRWVAEHTVIRTLATVGVGRVKWTGGRNLPFMRRRLRSAAQRRHSDACDCSRAAGTADSRVARPSGRGGTHLRYRRRWIPHVANPPSPASDCPKMALRETEGASEDDAATGRPLSSVDASSSTPPALSSP